jgi:tetratricopeptide (TPR) repeat protein
MISRRVPFSIGSRLLEVSKRYVDQQDVRSNLNIHTTEIFGGEACGEWETINELDQDLLDDSLRIGEFFYVTVWLKRYSLLKSEQGEFELARMAQNKLHEIGIIYNYDYAIIGSMELKTSFLIKMRSLQNTTNLSDEGICYARKIGNLNFEILLMGYKAEAQQLAGDTEGANDSLLKALELHRKHKTMPIYFSVYYFAARYYVEIEQIKQAIQLNNSEDIKRLSKRAAKTGKAALRNACKWASCRTKIFRLRGEYYWQVGKQGKAFKWWKKAINEGERLGARPDLSRTYFEVGKRLLETQSKFKKLNGMDARAYLEKAAVLFEEMEFARDLEELKAVRSLA